MTERNNSPQEEKNLSDMTDEELRQLLKTPRSAYVKLVLALVLIVGGLIAMFMAAAYFMASADKAIKETVRQLYPVPEQTPAETPETAPSREMPSPEPEKAPADPANQTESRVLKVDLTVAANLPKAVRMAADRVRPIRVMFMDSRIGFGNAIILEDNLAVTSAHIFTLDGRTKPMAAHIVCRKGDPPSAVKALAGSQVADILFLRVDCKAPAITYRIKIAHLAKVWISGLHFDFEVLSAKMWVRSTTVDRRAKLLEVLKPCFPPPVVQTMANHLKLFKAAKYQYPVAMRSQAYHGNSGSLIHDPQGRMVGVLFGGSCNNFSFFIPTVDVLRVARRGNVRLGGKRVQTR